MDKDLTQDKKEDLTPENPVAQSQKETKNISAEEVKKESVHEEKDKKEQKKEKKELKKSLKKPKKKQKADYVNFLLILAIFLLLTIIITPPILRVLMPKLEITKPIDKEKSIILACSAINIQEQYKITSRTKYVDNKPIQNIITYKKASNEELESASKNSSVTTTSVTSEINLFQEIRGVAISSNQDSTIVTIYDYVAKKNTGNSNFMNYFQNIDSQKTFYTNMGYTCEEISN